jgi:head-tail adaptor
MGASLADILNRGGRAPAAGDLDKVVRLEGPAGPARPDGHGGSTVEWVPLDPPGVVRFAAIQTQRIRGLEKLVDETAISLATHFVTMRYAAAVTTKTRIRYVDGSKRVHLLQVIGVDNPDEDETTTIAVCTEVVA